MTPSPGISNGALLSKYLSLHQPSDKIQLTYIWIDGKNGLRSKTRTVNFIPQNVNQLPVWNYDGSSTYQSDGSNADVYLKPVRLYRDPFRKGNNRLVLCETITYDGKPTKSNTRFSCNRVMNEAADQRPWFGIEQEYFMLDGANGAQGVRPFGWPKGGFPDLVEPYFCGVGPKYIRGRDVIMLHYRACLFAGVKLAGINSEGNKSQWEFQVGPCEGISIGDDLWMARYLLHRIAEDYNIGITLDPKPIPNYFGSGCHTNFSTKAMREPEGLTAILEAMPKLERNHMKHIEKYDLNGGADNVKRLIASPVTESIDKFSFGIGKRAASVRIPKQVADDGCGYFEDRRPASNIDPYVVAERMVRTVCLDQS